MGDLFLVQIGVLPSMFCLLKTCSIDKLLSVSSCHVTLKDLALYVSPGLWTDKLLVALPSV